MSDLSIWLRLMTFTDSCQRRGCCGDCTSHAILFPFMLPHCYRAAKTQIERLDQKQRESFLYSSKHLKSFHQRFRNCVARQVYSGTAKHSNISPREDASLSLNPNPNPDKPMIWGRSSSPILVKTLKAALIESRDTIPISWLLSFTIVPFSLSLCEI